MNSQAVIFTKMSGAGNTFVLVNGADDSWRAFERNKKISRPKLAQLICRPTLGISADGLLILEADGKIADYTWDFFNSDGSPAEMCGNASRCAARFCHERIEGLKKESFKFMTGAGLIEASLVGENRVRVKMPAIIRPQEKKALKFFTDNLSAGSSARDEDFVFVNTGVPHLVQKLENISQASRLKEMARWARSHADLQPEGSNVTFYAVDTEAPHDSQGKPNKIHAISFERGVEDFTLACGTGAVAAALAHEAVHHVGTVQVVMPGGVLEVSFPQGAEQPFMEGPAIFVGDFEYSPEVFA